MADWLQINDEEIASEPRKTTIRGVEVDVFVSPYDVPEAVKGGYDEDSGKFAIQFRYIGGEEPDERLVTEPINDHAIARVGKHSGRLYRLEVDVEKLKADKIQIRVHVEEALGKLERSDSPPKRSSNFEIARKAAEQRLSDMLTPLPAY